MSNIPKVYIDPQQLMDSSLQLAEQIFASGFKPDCIAAIWRGGTPVGIIIQEIYEYFNISTDHIAIRTSYYSGIDETRKRVAVYGLSYLLENMNAEDSLLLVDDVFDTGYSIKAVLDALDSRAGSEKPSDIRIATPYYKPGRTKVGDLKPDYYVYASDDWLIFPHELKGLSMVEIKQNKPWLSDYLEEIAKQP